MNYFDGKKIHCGVCRFTWPCPSQKEAQEGYAQQCKRCENIKDRHPELWDWVLGVVAQRVEDGIDQHVGDKSHKECRHPREDY